MINVDLKRRSRNLFFFPKKVTQQDVDPHDDRGLGKKDFCHKMQSH